MPGRRCAAGPPMRIGLRRFPPPRFEYRRDGDRQVFGEPAILARDVVDRAVFKLFAISGDRLFIFSLMLQLGSQIVIGMLMVGIDFDLFLEGGEGFGILALL